MRTSFNDQAQLLSDLDSISSDGDVNETPVNVFIGHNLGRRVFSMSVPFRDFYNLSDVANDREAGPVAQRALDVTHARNLAKYMLKGLVSAAQAKRKITQMPESQAFDEVLNSLGDQPYFSLQPIVCNIRDTTFGGSGEGGMRGIRLETSTGETAAFKIFLAERHILWVVDGQHRRAAAAMVLDFLNYVRNSGKYPAKAPLLHPDKGREISPDVMEVWNETYDATRSYSTLTIEVHLGLNVEQERQLFHDLNKLGKRVSSSMALEFDSSNPITQFVKSTLVSDGLVQVIDKENKDWANDNGEMPMKDVVAVTSLAFLNKSNAAGATPAIVEPRQAIIHRLWSQISEIEGFGEVKAKENTVAAQPVVLKALAKLTYDLNFSNRRPENGSELFEKLLDQIPNLDFSHKNPIWQFYELTDKEILEFGLFELRDWLPNLETSANRDLGSIQGEFFRFGAKHNDIFPIVGDMIRFMIGLPSRHTKPLL